MYKFTFSIRFYLGVAFIIISLVLGKATTALFFIYYQDPFLRWVSLAVYVLSWPLLFLGIWWAGREYYSQFKKYTSYQYYHQSLQRGTKKVYHKTKELGLQAREKVRQKIHEKRLTHWNKKSS